MPSRRPLIASDTRPMFVPRCRAIRLIGHPLARSSQACSTCSLVIVGNVRGAVNSGFSRSSSPRPRCSVCRTNGLICAPDNSLSSIALACGTLLIRRLVSINLLLHPADLFAQPRILADEPHHPAEIGGAQPENLGLDRHFPSLPISRLVWPCQAASVRSIASATCSL